MTTATTSRDPRLETLFLLSICGYFILHIVLRVYVSDSLDYDEAEQALLGQWLLPGYTEQPPLYTWIQYLLFKVCGSHVFAISLLKNSLLFFTYLFVFLISLRVLNDSRAAVLATASLLLIPQIGWESQRDMTHTTLVVTAAAASLWQILRLIESESVKNYCILGICFGVGLLAKANFALFTLILILTLISLKKGREILFRRRFLLTLIVAGTISGYYFLWMIQNQDIVFSATHKFKSAVDNYYIKGLGSLFTNSFLFLTPLWFIYLALFSSAFCRDESIAENPSAPLIKRFILFTLAVLVAVVLLFKVTYVKDRWLQPLLFIIPIFFFSRLNPAKITQKRFSIFLSIVLLAAVSVYAAFSIRVAGASYINRFCRLNYPFSAFAMTLRETGFDGGLIISDNRFLAGNMRLHFPGSLALIPGYRFEELADTALMKNALLVWKADSTRQIPEKLRAFVQHNFAIDLSTHSVQYITRLQKYGRTETVELATMQLPLAPTNPLQQPHSIGSSFREAEPD